MKRAPRHARRKDPIRWERPDEFDEVLLVAAPEDAGRRSLLQYLARLPGTARARALGRYPRFRVVIASTGDAALRRASAGVAAAAVDLALPRRGGVATIGELRRRRPDLALLAYGAAPPASDGMAAIVAGADFFHDCGGDPSCDGFSHALDVALARRRLTALAERARAEVEAARARLARLSGELTRGLPGLRQPHSRDEVVPFREAARRYLLAGARLFEGDVGGLAQALGLSYFALRRLLARYDVPFPKSRN